MYFFTGKFAAPALHATRFHDGGVLQTHGKLLRKIEQRKSNAYKQYGLCSRFGICEQLVQGLKIVEVKPALFVFALLYQFMYHKNQGGILSFEVRRQQAYDAPVLQIAVMLFKMAQETFGVQMRIAHIMARYRHARCTTALKHLLRRKGSRTNGMGFKKRNSGTDHCGGTGTGKYPATGLQSPANLLKKCRWCQNQPLREFLRTL
jgi:hypothetical protein